MSKTETIKRLSTLLTQNCPSPASSLPLLSSLPHPQIATYADLLTSVFERRRLQRLDTGAENKLDAKEMTKRSAHRAGFEMPEQYEDRRK